jgi:formylglycine-generating enzyme
MTVGRTFPAIVALGFFLSIGLPGCGKSPPPQAEGLQPVHQNPAAPAGEVARTESDGARVRRPPSRIARNSDPEPAEPAGEPMDPADAFVIVPEAANFEIVDSRRGADVFAVVPPADKATSSTFLAQADTPRASTQRPRPEFRLPRGFTALPEGGFSSDGLPWRIRCNTDGAEMALIPAGPFERGKDGASPEAAPAHRVFLDAYYIDINETTVGQFENYRDALRDEGKRPAQAPLNTTAPPNRPVVGVDWGDARAYAQWAGKDLPTEAQWEKAARGQLGFDYPWGNSRPVWSRARAPGQIDPVKSFRADMSPYGVFDMAGNVGEWCRDFYSDTAYQELTASGGAGIRNPEGPRRPSTPNARVVKGQAPDWTVWHRTGLSMRSREPNLGFRGVLTVSSPRSR